MELLLLALHLLIPLLGLLLPCTFLIHFVKRLRAKDRTRLPFPILGDETFSQLEEDLVAVGDGVVQQWELFQVQAFDEELEDMIFVGFDPITDLLDRVDVSLRHF